MGPQSDPTLPGIGAFVMGFGMGLVSLTTIVLVQDSVEWSMRGSATASIMFARSLGNTLGATVLGSILNLGIVHFASGDTWKYTDVPLEKAHALQSAASPGSFFHKRIRNLYSGVKVG